MRRWGRPSVFAVCQLLVFCAVALGQSVVRVEVKSGAAHVPGVSVTLNGTTVRTGADGIAILSAEPGPHEVTVSKEGFFPAKASLTVEPQSESHLLIELEPQEELEQQVTVYATRTDTRLQDLPTRVEVLNAEEIDEKVLMTPGDIVMMLNEMGGLRVVTTSASLGAASVRVQGMRGRYTRFLGDGLPLFGQQGGGFGLLQIPPADLEQVEVIKGVSSALYGAGAMAGVVNLISRRPSTRPVHDFLINRSTRGATDVTAFLASRLTSEWSGSFLGGGDFQQRNDIDHDGWADLAGYSRGVARPRLFWDGGDGRSAFLTGGITYENRRGGTVAGSVLPATGQPYEEALYTRRYDVGGNFQWLIRESYMLTARVAASSARHEHVFGEVRERDRHEMLFGEIAARASFGHQVWVAGVAAEREAYRPLDVPRFAYRYLTPGVFLQDDISVAPWLSISTGARADFHNRYGTFFSPRVAALLRGGGWTSRVSAGQGFFAPTPLTEETEAAGLARLVVPVPLVAERGRGFSADLTRTVGPAAYTVTFFGSRVDHPVYVDRSQRYQIVNLPGPARNLGFEFLGTWRKSPFTATASYTHVHSREPEEGRTVDTPLTPRHSFGLVGMWEKPPAWRLGVECYYTGRQRLEENPYRSRSEPYVVTGFLAERRFGIWGLFLNAENLTDARQTRWNSLLRPSRGVDGRWTVDAWAPLEGRVINGGVRLRF